jgi:hypothetical protein
MAITTLPSGEPDGSITAVGCVAGEAIAVGTDGAEVDAGGGLVGCAAGTEVGSGDGALAELHPTRITINPANHKGNILIPKALERFNEPSSSFLIYQKSSAKNCRGRMLVKTSTSPSYG